MLLGLIAGIPQHPAASQAHENILNDSNISPRQLGVSAELSVRQTTGQELVELQAGEPFLLVQLVTNATTATVAITLTQALPALLILDREAQNDGGQCASASRTSVCKLELAPHERGVLLWHVHVAPAAQVGDVVHIQGNWTDGVQSGQSNEVVLPVVYAAADTASPTATQAATQQPPATVTWPPTVIAAPSSQPTTEPTTVATATMPSPVPMSTPITFPTSEGPANSPPSASPAPVQNDDPYEPNNSYDTARTFPLTNTLKLTLPPGDADFYRFSVGEADVAYPVTVTVQGTFGLLTHVVVYRDSDRVAITQTDVARPQPSQTVSWQPQFIGDDHSYVIQISDAGSPFTAAAQGGYVLQIAVGPQITPPPSSVLPDSRGLDPEADQWENNWSPTLAPIIGPAMDFSANFVCPDPITGCSHQDQDYYQQPVKPGNCYRWETDQLGGGVDTNLLVIGADGVILAGNDDRAVSDLRSKVDWCVPLNGDTLVSVLVGPTVPLPQPLRERTYVLRASILPPEPTATPLPSVTPELSQPEPAPATATATSIRTPGTTFPFVPEAPLPADPEPTAPPSVPEVICEITAQQLNLRAGPGQQFNPPVAILLAGTFVTPLARNPGATWINVRITDADQVGWIAWSDAYVA